MWLLTEGMKYALCLQTQLSSESLPVRAGRVWPVQTVLRKPVGSFINFKILKYLRD